MPSYEALIGEAPLALVRVPRPRLRFYLRDGSVESFVQDGLAEAQPFLQQIGTGQLFNHPRIIVAGAHYKTVFVSSELNRIDLVWPHLEFWPNGYVDVVELTRAQFRKNTHLDDPARMRRREHHLRVGDLYVSFLDVRLAGGQRVYLMRESQVKLPAESQSLMRHLLSKGPFTFRLSEGGLGLLNLANLVRYTVYPGVPELPVDAWTGTPVE